MAQKATIHAPAPVSTTRRMVEGFGPHDERKLQIIPTIDLPPEAQEGDTVADEAGRTARIIWILPEKALVDLNHPLAGQPLIVTLQIVTIENPSEETSIL